MTHSIAKLCSALCLAICFSSASNAQEVVDQTGNLIDNGQWTGVGAYAPDPNDCCGNPAGSAPLYDTSSNTIKFSYGSATVGQIIGINNALGSSGLQVHGYTFQYDAKTVSENGGGSDPLTSSSFLKDGSGNTLLSSTYQHGVHDWQTFSTTQTLANPYGISGGGTVGVEFSGYDQGFWAGLYGPEVRNVSLRLNYSVGEDPCVTDPLSSTSCPGYAQAYKDQQCSINPLYDTTCPGYAQAYYDQQCSFNPLYDVACPGRSEVVTSGNLVPRAGNSTGWLGGSLNNSFAINQALGHAGSGVMIHGFNWGYRAINLSIFGSPLGSSTVNVNIRDGDGTSLHAWSRNNTSYGENWYSSSYVFPQSRNNTTLGNFDFTATSNGWGLVDSMWARAIFTPDSCSLDPLSSVLCTKYEEAFLAQQCSMNTLYSPSCPGYTEALAEMLAQSMSNGVEETSTQESSISIIAQPAPTSTVLDETKDPSQITTDVGGVELSTTGEIKVADAVPAAAKESTKQSDDKKEEKKLSLDQLRAIADRAVKETEKTALSVAESAIEQSNSESANPSDGIGLNIDIGGITLQNLNSITGQLKAGPDVLPNRNNSDDIVSSTRINQSSNVLQQTIDQTVSGRIESDSQAQDQAVEEKQNNQTEIKDLAAISTLPTIPVEPKEPQGPTVRRGGKVEGLEGGADINSLATAPMDFNDYLGKQLQDAQFYASKEIYKGQRNVDNARALRGLGTDRLHQQMVDQQYNITGQ